ncbi:MAG: hypothetical protein RLY32_2703, partial [Pseudomonadota bacterium]
RCVRDAEAGGSNPLTPTKIDQDRRFTPDWLCLAVGFFFLHPNIAKLYGETIRDRGEREDKFADLVQAALAFQQGRVKLPQSLLSITPDIAEHLPDLALPTAQVFVLSAARTFW